MMKALILAASASTALAFGYSGGDDASDDLCISPGAILGFMAFPTPVLTMPENFSPVGSHTAHICEASDAAISGATIEDGASGDTDYPYGEIKVLCTVGEYAPDTGFMIVGVPDGMGAYLLDDSTVRIVFQSESYGPVTQFESYPFIVNDNGASFTGSHVQYVDYDREMLAEFMTHDESAAGMVKAAGSVVENSFNLRGDMVGERPLTGCADAPHFSNTDKDGCGLWTDIMDSDVPTNGVDWLMQSLCSAHLEEAHQWGDGLGVEDTLFITNEEWTDFVEGANFTGIPVHAIDLSTFSMYAVGVFTLGGFEKVVEVNCGHPDYVCFSPSGYNGAFGVTTPLREGTRLDGTPYVWPHDIVPARLYVGKKGFNASGEPSDSFLARNGLAYGQLYGFATGLETTRDEYHTTAANGDVVNGGFYPIDWRWDGEVNDFTEDGCWDFQHLTGDDGTWEFWNAAGRDVRGSKTEHNTPDPHGLPRFIQGSTAGYFGIYSFDNVTSLLNELEGDFPAAIPATYTVLQGETDITAQIMLGGKGQYAHGGDATMNYDDAQEPGAGKVTFEDVDGIEWISAADSEMGYLVIQEDSGNDYGERTFIGEVSTSGEPMTYYFIAMSGGSESSRLGAGGVGVPAGTNAGPGSHEFSGIIDLSGMIAKDSSGNFIAKAGDGASKRAAEKMVNINDKILALGLQAHNLNAGIIAQFHGDRGGQVYAYQPNLP